MHYSPKETSGKLIILLFYSNENWNYDILY